MYNKTKLLPLLLLIFLSSSTLYASIGKIVALRGDATVTRDAQKYIAQMGMDIEEKDIITTQRNSKMQIIFEDKTIFTIGRSSTLGINEYLNSPTNPKASFSMVQGAFKTITGKIGKIAPNRFKVKTKSATIGIRGTGFMTTVDGDTTKVVVSQGEVSVTDNEQGGSVNVPAGFTTSKTSGSKLAKPTVATTKTLKKMLEKLAPQADSDSSDDSSDSSGDSSSTESQSNEDSKEDDSTSDESSEESSDDSSEEGSSDESSEESQGNNDAGEQGEGSGAQESEPVEEITAEEAGVGTEEAAVAEDNVQADQAPALEEAVPVDRVEAAAKDAESTTKTVIIEEVIEADPTVEEEEALENQNAEEEIVAVDKTIPTEQQTPIGDTASSIVDLGGNTKDQIGTNAHLSWGYWNNENDVAISTYVDGIATAESIMADHVTLNHTGTYSGDVTGLENGSTKVNGNFQIAVDLGSSNPIDVTSFDASGGAVNWNATTSSSAVNEIGQFQSNVTGQDQTGYLKGQFYGTNAEAIAGTAALTDNNNNQLDAVFTGIGALQ
jgi:hypothetical protein